MPICSTCHGPRTPVASCAESSSSTAGHAPQGRRQDRAISAELLGQPSLGQRWRVRPADDDGVAYASVEHGLRAVALAGSPFEELGGGGEDGAAVVVASGTKPLAVGHWLTFWLDHVAPARVQPSTLDGYRSKVTHRIVPARGGYRLDALQPEHVEAWRDGLRAEGLAAATVLQRFRILSRALMVAVQRGKISRNVCTLVDAPSVDRDEVRPLTAVQARRILAVAADDQNPARWSVALSLGLRQGEALGIAWDAVDLDAGTLTVRQALQRRP
jgi:hypothetical protein